MIIVYNYTHAMTNILRLDKQSPHPRSLSQRERDDEKALSCTPRPLGEACLPVRQGLGVRVIIAALFLFFSFSSAFGNAFLESVVKDGIGVRPLGMGGAFVAVSDDGNSIYYNPAALADSKTQYIRGYMDMNSDVYIRNDCYTVTMPQAGWGYWNRQDKLGNKADVTAFSFGTKGQNAVAWGVTYKNISWDTGGSQARGWTMDGGLKASFSKEMAVGILVQDLLKNSAPISSSLRMGIAISPQIVPDTVFAVDSEFRNLKSAKGADIYMRYGAETKITETLVVRGGWDRERFSGGVTAVFPYITADYAVIVNADRENTQMFGFRFSDAP
ncbi:MAG: hypothetical protein WC527_02145 [Candidatus Margulisiibacteriota bacterium]